MKKMNKKGFTIVELVIVIAVIAILAAVMIPTFSGIVTKAQKSAKLQEARSIMTEYIASKDAQVASKYYIRVGDSTDTVYFEVSDGKLDDDTCAAPGNSAIIVAEDNAKKDGNPETTDADKWPDEIQTPAN